MYTAFTVTQKPCATSLTDIAMRGRYTVPSIDLKAYARRGAEARIAELTAELNDIYRAFPDLRRGSTHSAPATTGAGGRRRGRKPMSAAQKAAVSKRMKKYWATRRKASA